jgi:hypothetical protein
MGELGRDWARGVGVTVPVTGGGGNNQAWPLCWPLVSCVVMLASLQRWSQDAVALRARPSLDSPAVTPRALLPLLPPPPIHLAPSLFHSRCLSFLLVLVVALVLL